MINIFFLIQDYEFKLLNESTLNHKRLTLTLFFNFMYERNITEISSVAHSDIYDFLEYISNRNSSNRKSSMSFILRHFFNYTYQNQMTDFDYSHVKALVVADICTTSIA